MKFFKLRKNKPLVFMYSERFSQSGSTIMRGHQLSEIVKQHIPYLSISYIPLQDTIKNSVIYLTKGALKDLSADEILGMKSKKNIILIDPVDDPLPIELSSCANVVIAASITAYNSYQQHMDRSKIALINHNVDPRIDEHNLPRREDFRVGYFGELFNTIKTPRLSTMVDFVQVNTGFQDNKWMERILSYPMHYGIRSEEVSDIFKPFLKGFTAAHCNANIIIQDTNPEAMLWLGKDYPYLLREGGDEKQIINILKKARIDFEENNADWNQALQTMENIKRQTSASAIATQVAQAYHQALSL